MPFVTQDHRDNPDMSIPGDLCYLWYKLMVDTWKKESRWTTAARLYDMVRTPDENLSEQRAKELAWQVFFIKYVMKYEDQKELENGTI